MWLSIILYIVIVLSFIAIATILARKLPAATKLTEEEIINLDQQVGIIKKSLGRIKALNYRHRWLNSINYLLKALGKIKDLVLKTEKGLVRLATKLKEGSSEITQKSKQWVKRSRKKANLEPVKIETKVEIKPEVEESKPKKPNFKFSLAKIKFWSKKEEKIETIVRDRNNQKKDLIEWDDQIEDQNDSVEIKLESIAITKTEEPEKIEEKDLSILDLEKPVKEEQRFIDQIVENPKNITAYKALGMFYWKIKSYEDAKASLEMVVKLGSKDKKVQEILKKIADKKN